MIYKKGRGGAYLAQQRRTGKQEMRGGRGRKRGRKKTEGISGLEAGEFDLKAIKEIKKRKRGLRNRHSRNG